MKKIVFLFITACLFLSFTSCSPKVKLEDKITIEQINGQYLVLELNLEHHNPDNLFLSKSHSSGFGTEGEWYKKDKDGYKTIAINFSSPRNLDPSPAYRVIDTVVINSYFDGYNSDNKEDSNYKLFNKVYLEKNPEIIEKKSEEEYLSLWRKNLTITEKYLNYNPQDKAFFISKESSESNKIDLTPLIIIVFMFVAGLFFKSEIISKSVIFWAIFLINAIYIFLSTPGIWYTTIGTAIIASLILNLLLLIGYWFSSKVSWFTFNKILKEERDEKHPMFILTAISTVTICELFLITGVINLSIIGAIPVIILTIVMAMLEEKKLKTKH